MKYYLIRVVGDVEPEVHGPYKSTAERERKAIEMRRKHGDRDGIYPASVYKDGTLCVGAYSGAFFDEANENAP